MPSYLSRKIHQAAVVGAAALLASSVGCGNQKRSPAQAPAVSSRALQAPVTNVPGTSIAITAQRMTTTLRDGTPAPMWGYCASASCPTPVTGAWSPGPTIVATAGTSLSINLTNNLPVPTSLVVLGQLGGGLGTPTKMNGPAHNGQNVTTFPNNSSTAEPEVRPAPAGAARQLVRDRGRREREPDPDLEQPQARHLHLRDGDPPFAPGADGPVRRAGGHQRPDERERVFTPGTAYPGVSYDADTALLFSEIDVVQNRAVDAAAVALAPTSTSRNDPSCSTTNTCVAAYPGGRELRPDLLLHQRPVLRQDGAAELGVPAGRHGELRQRQRPRAAPQRRIADPRPVDRRPPMALVAEDGNPLPGIPSSRARCSSPPARPTTPS